MLSHCLLQTHHPEQKFQNPSRIEQHKTRAVLTRQQDKRNSRQAGSESLNLGMAHVLVGVTLCPVHRRVFSSLPGLFPATWLPHPQFWQPQACPDIADRPPGVSGVAELPSIENR